MNKKILILVIVLLLVVGVVAIIKTSSSSKPNGQETEKWTAKYIHPLDWPPQAQVLDESFTCTEADVETGEGSGKTEKRVISGHTYCVTEVVGAAAGSVYTQYTYAFAEANKTVVLTFTLQAVQCANYSEPEKTACEKERESFAIDPIIDKIAESKKKSL